MPFLTPYEQSKFLEGVIPGDNPVRSNFLQQWFAEPANPFRTGKTVNFDVEFNKYNVAAMHVLPTVDAPKTELQGFGTKEMYFSYVKEGFGSPSYEEISNRQLGQPFGQVDLLANYLTNLKKKAAIVEQNIETRFEVNAASLIVSGSYTAQSEKHPAVLYDFNRTVVTTDAGYLAGKVPEIDLTTLNGNGGVGKRAWNATGGTKAPTPYEDFIKAVSTCADKSMPTACIMSADAFKLFNADVIANYKTAADLNYQVAARIELQILPMLEKFNDLTYRGSYQVSPGIFIDVYSYEAIYHDRTSLAETKFIPAGSMVVLPKKTEGLTLYGRVQHIDAGFEPMRRYTHIWKDAKYGTIDAETHVSYVMGHRNIDSLVYWKVM